jgi:hypothetical protein
MNNNLWINNNFTDYGILIGCGLILGFSLIYLLRNNYTTIPPKNMAALTNENIEVITNEEIEAIVNENAVTVINNDNIYAITDSDSETDIASDYESISDNESTSSDESISEFDFTDLDLFFMPNVDLDVCSIQELKFFEISSIYYREIAANSVTDEELLQLIYWLSEKELFTNKVNSFILWIITHM